MALFWFINGGCHLNSGKEISTKCTEDHLETDHALEVMIGQEGNNSSYQGQVTNGGSFQARVDLSRFSAPIGSQIDHQFPRSLVNALAILA